MISTYKLTLILLFLIQVYRIQAEFSNVPRKFNQSLLRVH